YEAVTSYVKEEMGKVDELKGPRKGSVGFALTALQRRLASSPEAIFQSLKRRRERLESRLREENLLARGQQFSAQNLETPPEDDDDLSAEEQEELEEKLTDTATAAETIAELEAESPFSLVWSNKHVAWWIQDLIANGTNSLRFCRTIPTCAMQVVASAR